MVPKPLSVRQESDVIRIGFVMEEEILVETLSIFYTINYQFIIRDHRWYPRNTTFVHNCVPNLPIGFWA